MDKTWNFYHTAPSLLHSHEMADRSSHLRSLKPHESALWISLSLHHLVKLATPELSTDYGAPLFKLSIIDNLRFHFLLASILGPTASNQRLASTENLQLVHPNGFTLLVCVLLTALTLLHYPCGGGVEYLHRDPASRKRRRNGTKKKAAP
jgi:hypothetical protein